MDNRRGWSQGQRGPGLHGDLVWSKLGLASMSSEALSSEPWEWREPKIAAPSTTHTDSRCLNKEAMGEEWLAGTGARGPRWDFGLPPPRQR